MGRSHRIFHVVIAVLFLTSAVAAEKIPIHIISLGTGTQIALWNRTMWDKAGLTPPNTWESLLVSMKQLTDTLGPDGRALDSNSGLRIYMTHSFTRS